MATYSPIVVLLGQAKIAAAIAGGPSITIKNLAVGDGGGVTTVPIETMTALVNEVGRVLVTSAARDTVDNTKVIVTAVLPINMGPFVIREVALFTDDGQLFAIGGYPETFKSTPAQGATVEVTIEFVIQVASTANVEVTLNIANLTAIDQLLRMPFIGVDSFTNDPPSSPAAGDLVVVGLSPTGAFVGKPNRLAQFDGSLWVTAIAPERTVVGDKTTGKYYRKTATTWVDFIATETEQGIVTHATLAQTKTGVLANVVTNPAGVAGAVQTGQWNYAVAGGTENALTATLFPVPTAIAAGFPLRIEATAAPTGAATVNVNTLGAVSVVYPDGAAIGAGAWESGAILDLLHDGTNFQLVGITGSMLIDTAVTKTVHGASPDFLSLIEALEWVSKYRITQKGSVLFNVRAGQFSYTNNIVIDHPNADRITISAPSLNSTPSSTTFTVTGSGGTARTADIASQLTALRACFATEFDFVGAAHIDVRTAGCTINNLLCVGDLTNSTTGIYNYSQYLTLNDVVCMKFAGAGIDVVSGLLNLVGVIGCVGCNVGIGGGPNGSILSNVTSIFMTSNVTHGISMWGGLMRGNNAGSVLSRGNGVFGIYCYNGGNCYIDPGSLVEVNAGGGVYCYQGDFIGATCTYRNNGGYGVRADDGSVASIPSSSLTGNTTNSTYAGNGAFISAASASGVSGASSPAINTIGNNNAFVLN